MRILLTLLTVSILLFSCEKAEVEETPGNISGMGNAEGEISTTPYVVPEGIEFIGTISGTSESTPNIAVSETNQDLLKSAEFFNYFCGSGGTYINVVITLKNVTEENNCLTFPRGLVCGVDKKEYQNGILLQDVGVCFEPLEEKTIVLSMYCVNKGLFGSDEAVEYIIQGISNSQFISEILNYLENKSINVEHYISDDTPKPAGYTYLEIVRVLQNALWSITNGDGLTEEFISFIDGIPEL